MSLQVSSPSLSDPIHNELPSLAAEEDSELRAQGLLALAGRLESSGREESALQVYSLLPENGQAQARVDALAGKGSFGAVFESQFRRFGRETFQAQSILPMVAGSAVYGLARTALLGRLISNPTASIFTRGLGARWASSGGAFLAEVPAFAATVRALQGNGDLAHTALTLGVLKSFGAAGAGAAQRWQGSALFWGQASIFAGLMAAQGLEEKLGFAPERGTSAKVASTLSSMFSLGAGARIGSSILGPSFARFRGELELRARSSEWQPPALGRGFSPTAQSAGIAKAASAASVRSFEAWQSQSRGGTAASLDPGRKPNFKRLKSLIDEEFLPEAWKAFPTFKELKSELTPLQFQILASKIAPLFEDPAMNRRAYAFIFLDRLVPGLSSYRRALQLRRIDKGMKDEDPWVRELATQAFDHNAPFWSRENLVARTPELQRLSRDPEKMVREAAFRGLVRMTEFLAPEQRMPHLRGLARHFAKTGNVNHLKTLPFNRALRSLTPPERLQVARQFERVLQIHAEDFHFVPFFGDMIWRLAPEHHAGRLRALEQLYQYPDVPARIHAMTAVDNNMERLPRQKWPERIRQFEIAMRSREPRVRERAVTILGGLYSSEPGFFEGSRIRVFDRRLKDSDPLVRRAALEAQQRVALALDPAGRQVLLSRLIEHWSSASREGRGETENAVQSIYEKMKIRESQRWGRYLEERFGSRIPEGLKINRPD